MCEKNSSEEMTSFEVLPTQNGLSESFDSAEFSFIPPANLEENYDLTNMQSAMTSATSDLSIEIQARLVELLEENGALKEALKKNNVIMQEQMSTVSAWHNQMTSSMSMQQISLSESKKRIQQLERENTELQLKVKELERQSEPISPENASFTVINLVKEDAENPACSMKESEPNSPQKRTNVSSSDFEEYKKCCEVLQQQVDDFQKAIEEVKSSDGEIIQRLQQEVLSLQDALKTAQNNSIETSQHMSNVQALYEELQSEYDRVKKLLEECTENKGEKELKERCEDKTKQEREEAWKVKFDVYQNKLDMADSLVEKYKERCESLQQQVDEYQMKLDQIKTSDGHIIRKLQEELQSMQDKLKVEQYNREEERCRFVEMKTQFERIKLDYARVTELLEKHSQQDNEKSENFATMREAEGKKHLEQIDNLTAQLFDTQQKLEEQMEKVQELNSELNTVKQDGEIIPVLKAQVEVYKADLNNAVLAREAAQEEVEKLSQELNNLYSSLSLCSSCDASRAISDLRSKSRLRMKDKVGNKKNDSRSEHKLFVCPVCSHGFTELKAAENHVNNCIDNAP